MRDRAFVYVLIGSGIVIALLVALAIWVINSDMPLWLKIILLK